MKQKYKIAYINKKHVYKKRKEITHGEIGERTVIITSNIYISINKYKVCYHNLIT